MKHLSPNLKDDNQHDHESTGHTNSKFNEKKTSRFLSYKEDYGDEDELLKESMSLSRRSSMHRKKGSMQSLIVESLKFLNDDTDVVPKKREPLIP